MDELIALLNKAAVCAYYANDDELQQEILQKIQDLEGKVIYEP